MEVAVKAEGHPKHVKKLPPNIVVLGFKNGCTNLTRSRLLHLADIRAIPLLAFPFTPSDISGELGFEYRTRHATVNVTEDEMYRLVLRCLTPEQYFSLFKKVGMFFDINAEFYDTETGEALQPRPRPARAPVPDPILLRCPPQ